MKKIAIGIIVILAIIIAVLVYLASQAGSLIKQGVNEYGPEVLGAPVTLEGADVAFLGGTAGLSGLTVGNPEGFKSDHAFKLGAVSMALDVGSVTSDVIRIKEVRISGADLIYELGKGGNNISALQKNVEKYAASLGVDTTTQDDSATTKKFVIDNVYIEGTKVKLATGLLGGGGAGLTLPDIHLKDIGKESNGAGISEVMNKILGSITGGLGKTISPDMIKDLGKGLGDGVGDVGKGIGDVGKDVKKKLGDLF